MTFRRFDLFTEIPADLAEESFAPLLRATGARLERIVSKGHRTPEGSWYDQEEDEWVLLLSGETKLLVEGASAEIHLVPGQGVFLPAHCRHRVQWTAADAITIWLALFLPAGTDLGPSL